MRKVQRRYWYIKSGFKIARKNSKKLWARKVRYYKDNLSDGSEYKKLGSEEKYAYIP